MAVDLDHIRRQWAARRRNGILCLTRKADRPDDFEDALEEAYSRAAKAKELREGGTATQPEKALARVGGSANGLSRKNVTDSSGHEHAGDGRFTGPGGGGNGTSRPQRESIAQQESRAREETSVFSKQLAYAPIQRQAFDALAGVYVAASGITSVRDMKVLLTSNSVGRTIRGDVRGKVSKSLRGATEGLSEQFGDSAKDLTATIDNAGRDFADHLSSTVTDSLKHAAREVKRAGGARKEVLEALREGLGALANPDASKDAFVDVFNDTPYGSDVAEQMIDDLADWPVDEWKLIGEGETDLAAAHERLQSAGVDIAPEPDDDWYSYAERVNESLLEKRRAAVEEVWSACARALLPEKAGGDSAKSFDESKHPRGQPGNAGEFASASGGGGKKPKPGKPAKKPAPKEEESHPGAAHGSEVKVKLTKERAAPRNARGKIDPIPVQTQLSKQETGRVAEAGIRAYLRDIEGISDTVALNAGKTNESIDLFGDSMAPEVKGGLCSNSVKAQQWRITFSMELGAKEQAEYDALSSDQQKAWREKRQRACLERKLSLLKKISKERGKKINPVTYTGIVNPDKRTIDIYKTDGYHQRLDWNDPKANYIASVTYDHA